MIVQIETNNDCNHRCWYCQNAHYQMPASQVMGLKFFESIIKEIRMTYSQENLSIASFAAYNEPTLDPYIQKRLRMLTELGFQYWFISNGSHMTSDLVEFIIKEQIAIYAFLFNVPAIDPDEFHTAVQVPAERIFPIRDNLVYLLKNRERINADITIIVHGDQSQTHHRNFQRMQAFFLTYGVNVVFGPVMNRAGMLDGVVKQKIDHQTDSLACRAKYLSNIYVGVNGNVYLCCHDYYQRYSYGNFREASLKALLNSKNHYIEKSRFKRHFCRYCPFAVAY